MSVASCIIAIIVISFCLAVLVGCFIYRVLKDEFDERVGRLEDKVQRLEERYMHLEDIHLDHMVKYH